jgi:hypothetical protein
MMKSSLLSMLAAATLLAGGAPAMAQAPPATANAPATTTVTTWTNEHGATIREYTTTQKYPSINDPSFKAARGMALPQNYTLYPLPPTLTVPDPDAYSYSIVNDRPVVVERTTRTIVHTWD